MRTFRIKNWNKPNYNYDVQIEDCEKGKIISFVRTTKNGDWGFAKQIDRVAVSNVALRSIGLTEENLVEKLRTNGELRSILKFGEDLVSEGKIRTSQIFLSLLNQRINVHYESYAAKHKFELALRKQDYNLHFLEKLARTIDYTDRPDSEILLQEPALTNLKKVIAEEDEPIVGKTLTSVEKVQE